MYSYIPDDILIKGISLGELPFKNIDAQRQNNLELALSALVYDKSNVRYVSNENLKILFDSKKLNFNKFMKELDDDPSEKFRLMQSFSVFEKDSWFELFISAYKKIRNIHSFCDNASSYNSSLFTVEMFGEFADYLKKKRFPEANALEFLIAYKDEVEISYKPIKNEENHILFCTFDYIINYSYELDMALFPKFVLNNREYLKQFVDLFFNFNSVDEDGLETLFTVISQNKNWSIDSIEYVIDKLIEANSKKKFFYLNSSCFDCFEKSPKYIDIFKLITKKAKNSNMCILGSMEFSEFWLENKMDKNVVDFINNSDAVDYMSGYYFDYKDKIKALFSKLVMSDKTMKFKSAFNKIKKMQTQ